MAVFDFNSARPFGHDPSTSTWKEQADERWTDDLLAAYGLPADARVQPLRPSPLGTSGSLGSDGVRS
jgi:hypothetical protein